MTEAIKRVAQTKWTKENYGHLVSEVLIGYPTRSANYAELKYGQKEGFWKGVSDALKTRQFPGDAYPSGKSCMQQFERLLKDQQDAKANHKFKSGTTEELNEIEKGLEEVLQDLDRVAHLGELAEEEAEGKENRAVVQEEHLKRARATPKKVVKGEAVTGDTKTVCNISKAFV